MAFVRLVLLFGAFYRNSGEAANAFAVSTNIISVLNIIFILIGNKPSDKGFALDLLKCIINAPLQIGIV